MIEVPYFQYYSKFYITVNTYSTDRSAARARSPLMHAVFACDGYAIDKFRSALFAKRNLAVENIKRLTHRHCRDASPVDFHSLKSPGAKGAGNSNIYIVPKCDVVTIQGTLLNNLTYLLLSTRFFVGGGF